MATATASAPVGKKSTKAKVVAEETADPDVVPVVKKARISATEEEINAAVDGTLQPRSTKGTEDQASLTHVGESGRPSGRPIGVTTGLPIIMAWSYFFIQNEKAKKQNKLTDEQITQQMKEEFPGRESNVFNYPASVRRNYNNGVFTKGRPPEIQSVRYDENGNEYVKAAKGEKKPATTEEAEPEAAVVPMKGKKSTLKK